MHRSHGEYTDHRSHGEYGRQVVPCFLCLPLLSTRDQWCIQCIPCALKSFSRGIHGSHHRVARGRQRMHGKIHVNNGQIFRIGFIH
jgi:hypothetical protein